MKYELRNNARYFNDDELLDDLRNVAQILGKDSVSSEEYNKHGKFCHGTFQKRFGSWNKALQKANLNLIVQKYISNKELFDNLEIVWRTLGHQPLYSEMKKPLSKYSTRPYDNRFGGWMKACMAFIDYKKGDIEFVKLLNPKPKLRKRDISEKMRLRILKRDFYRCVKCGRSPATHRGIVLHIDHIIPFSKGGDNSFGNLQTLCNKCNLGKADDETV